MFGDVHRAAFAFIVWIGRHVTSSSDLKPGGL
jgi:hypothetical protein